MGIYDDIYDFHSADINSPGIMSEYWVPCEMRNKSWVEVDKPCITTLTSHEHHTVPNTDLGVP